MRPSYARAHVLELLEQHGPLTRREMVALDPSLSVNAMSPLVVKWLEQGIVVREKATDRVLLTYRYAITEKGRAVLAADRLDREAGEFERVGSLQTIEVGTRRLTIAEAAAEFGLKPKTLRTRLERGMPVEKALRAPRTAMNIEVAGGRGTVEEVAARAGVSHDTVRRRLREGRKPDEVAAPAYYRPTCSREAIRELLASSPAPMTQREIGRALGFHEDAVRGHLVKMRSELIREPSDARGHPLLYSLATGPDARSAPKVRATKGKSPTRRTRRGSCGPNARGTP